MDHELNVANKYGLFWAGALVEDEEGKALADGFYIYQPERFSDTFFLLFDKLRQLNDYCFNQLLSTEKRLRMLAGQRSAAAAQKHCGAEEVDYLDDQIPMWEDNVEVVGRATSIVLLCSFVEWGLKLVTRELCGAIPRKRAHSMSDFEFMLDHLEHNGGLHLDVDDESIDVVNSFRRIRNTFAHGDWTTLNEQLKSVSLRACFEAVARIFQCIEESAWQSPWGNLSS
ncbi:hypothetical protein WS46_32685 [Burkholderia sp. RF4-BP95]|nr:hypothetical protein WS46_32685 [Burkholderia sp. RF4-BP95]